MIVERKLKSMWLVLGLALLAVAACADSTTDQESGEQASTTDQGGELLPQEPPPLATGAAPAVDIDAQQVDTPAGTIEAERTSEHTHVGKVTEDLYLSVSLEEGADAETPQDATVYLCDREDAEWLTGTVDAGTTVLEGEALDVELSLAGEGLGVSVIPEGQDPLSVDVTEASGAGGLYAADFSFEGHEYRGRWVVLRDGSQRGAACWRCCGGQRCTICCCAPGSCVTMN